MANLIFGIITIAICIFGYFIAFKQLNKNNITLSLILIILCGFLLRIYASTDYYLHAWDERYHALVAKNMIEHPFQPTLYNKVLLPYDYKNWTNNHIWLHKQPIPLWTMALSMSVFGINEIALRIPSILLTTIGIWITFFIGNYLFNKRVGIIAAFLYSIHGLIIEVTAGRIATDHIDAFFLFFVQLSVLFAIKYFQGKKPIYNIFCGVSIGLAILSKWLPALIVLPIWLLLALDSNKLRSKEILINFLVLCFVIICVSIPWQLYIFSSFPQEAHWESSFNIKHITEILENHENPFYYHFDKLRMIFGELIYLPLIWFFYKTFKNLKNFKRLAITIWILIPFIFFSFAKTKMQAYTLFTAPAIFIVTGVFCHYLYRFRNRFRFKWIIIALLILLIALPVRYSIERIKPFSKRDTNPHWTKELRALNHETKIHEKIVIFNSEYPIETMFYNDCIAYSIIPDSSILSNIKNNGYKILIRRKLDIDYDHNDSETNNIILTGHNTAYSQWLGN
jgi:4-amino-4-deoxy-L-arabinose transferase-like glycosyltransferase